MRRSEDFARTIRSGVRSGSDTLVVHVLRRPGPETVDPALVGFVVSRAVGGAVVRTRVKRRLRHQVSARLATLPPSSRVVVRALPPAAAADSDRLGRDLERALGSAVRRTERVSR